MVRRNASSEGDMIGIPRHQALHEFPLAKEDEVVAGAPPSEAQPTPAAIDASPVARPDARSMARVLFRADAGWRVQSLAQATSRSQAVARFDEIRQSAATMSPGHPEVLRAIGALALNIGGSSGCGFGMGRGTGAAIAELGIRYHFDTRMPLGIGEDRNYIDQDTDLALQQLCAVVTLRWLGATLVGGTFAALGGVLAPRAAALTGRQLAAIAPERLIPDHVANLLDETGAPYGDKGVDRLRREIQQVQQATGQIDGTTHVRSGVVAFGVLNAVRGTALGQSPVGVMPDIGISTAVSFMAGMATGLIAGTLMARKRHLVPDARHTGDGQAPLVQVPLFEVKKTAPVMPRFTGTGACNGLGNLARGIGDRIRLLAVSTWLLALLGVLVSFAGAATRREPLNWVHRVGKAIELGVGVGAAVDPYFGGLPAVLARDRARLERQQAQLEWARLAPLEPRADAESPVETLALRQL
ncbi:hypothetical protein ACFJIX_16490 [Roseateles sp. UC29_93]|uniref:hypothetical protein n=1 Tax=Roseateles sp. UC29_93 TaxID=3350177 RepID=UPI00366B206B